MRVPSRTSLVLTAITMVTTLGPAEVVFLAEQAPSVGEARQYPKPEGLRSAPGEARSGTQRQHGSVFPRFEVPQERR